MSRNLGKAAVWVAVMEVFSKILGLLREIFLAQRFGTSYIVDAYTVACSFPLVLFSFYASGITASYMPVYSRIKKQEDQDKFYSITMTILGLFSLAVMIGCMLLSYPITRFLVPGYAEDAFRLTEHFIKIISIYLPIYTCFSMFCVQANINEQFEAVHFCNSILNNVIIIIAIFIASPLRPDILVWGYIIAAALAACALGMFLVSKDLLNYKPAVEIRNRDFIGLLALSVPGGLSLFANQINAMIDKTFSSVLGEGITSALSYANRLQLLPYTLVVSIFLSVCNPKMNKYFASGEIDNGMHYVRKAVMTAVYISIPVVICIGIFAFPIVRLIFERGAFGGKSTEMTANSLILYAIGIPFYSYREILTKLLTANLQQRKILKNTILSVGINIILDAVLVRSMGYKGLALATSIAGLAACVFMTRDVDKINLKIAEREMLSDTGKIIVSSVVSCIAGAAIFQCLSVFINSNMAVCAALIIVVLFYFVMSSILQINIFYWVRERLPIKFKISRFR